ncbi:hypothetical protein BOX15_Mlig009939g1 [Macrostomum lignano]|uniref:Uncharacterized protein n=2 Tax=Macrostomum lignano TaxID=282301 RepID=A0A267GR31_9PLAT|nr:hypothetical protein BOX15_Mlig009939g3 [Macrostomum lignano]PAA87749.1 hypothetical protein BOX15_Mlig009939g1 [Macrostomum lignano]
MTNPVVQKVNPMLTEERAKASFPVEELTYILDGGKFNTEKRREIEELVTKDPNFEHPPIQFMTREQQYSLAVKKALLVQQRLKELDMLDDPYASYFFRRIAMPREVSPIGLHWVMFVPTLMGQCSDEQRERWLQRALNYEIIGTYAQTEMGHGTFLRGIETTATYDPSSQQFVLHSPTTTSIKWWPGGLGKTCNYAVVVAQLHTQGRCHGVHMFLVQLRDESTHRSLPGVVCGDIGPKMGYHTIDNGFLQLNSVRIPRENMLMRNAEVQPDGTYIRRVSNEKLTYGTMVFVRSLIVSDAARGISEAATIAVRYACVRRQGEPSSPGAPEPRLLDYPVHQYRLLTCVANCYGLWFASEVLRDLYFTVQPDVLEGRTERLPETHALSAGLKAVGSNRGAACVEECRRCCGGFGFSEASGLPKIYNDINPACTYEGENTVMLLQTGRHLLKCVERARRGEQLAPSDAYIRSRPTPQPKLAGGPLTADLLLGWLRWRSLSMLLEVSGRFNSFIEQRQAWADAFQAVSRRLTRCAEAHCILYVGQAFLDSAKAAENPKICGVLTSLCRLFLLNEVVSGAGDVQLSRSDLARCQDAIDSLLTELRPNAVALVEAFDLPDRMLCSVIGRYDGQVYEAMLQWARQSPLNATDVHESYELYTRQFLAGRSLAKL